MSQSVFTRSNWIRCPGTASVNSYAVFETDFSCAESDLPVDVRISVHGGYALFTGTRFVAAGQYSDYPEAKTYEEIRLGEDLTGSSVPLRIVVWSPCSDSSVYRGSEAGLLFEVISGEKVLQYSGAHVLCAPHGQYLSGPMENITGQLGWSFAYDANGVMPPLQPAEVIPPELCGLTPPSMLKPRPVSRLVPEEPRPSLLKAQGSYILPAGGTPAEQMQRAWMAFRPLNELSPGTPAGIAFNGETAVPFACEEGDGIWLLLDQQKETVGWLDLELEVPEACEVLIGWGEHTDDLRLRTRVGSRNFAVRYQAQPGRQRFIHYYRRLGLRYLQLFVRSHRFRLYRADLIPTVYPLKNASSFVCGDALHRRIYDTCAETLRMCCHDHYEDCPWREQALYAMDSRNQMLCGYYAFGETAMPKASIRLLAQGLRQDHLLELCAPARVGVTIPAFSAIFAVELAEYLAQTDDRDFAREMLPVAEDILQGFLDRRNQDGLIPVWKDADSWNFYEWLPGLDGTDRERIRSGRADAPLNCFAVMALHSLTEILHTLGEDAARWESAAAALSAAVNTHFADPSDGLYATWLTDGVCEGRHGLTQALAVCAGVCPENRLDTVLAALNDPVHYGTTLSYSIFRYEALMRRPERYGRQVFDEIAEIWGHMLFQGGSTFWETAVGADDFDKAGSLCHGWSAIPIVLYEKYWHIVYPEACI